MGGEQEREGVLDIQQEQHMTTVKAVVHLESRTPYSQSRFIMTEKPSKMKHDEWEEKSWRERGWQVTSGPDKGKMFIPAQQFKNAMIEAAKYLGIKIKGKGQATYTKHFTSGIMVENDLILPVKLAECEADTVMVSADGKPGGAKKVKKNFPIVQQWEGTVTFIIIDETIDREVFEQHLHHAGMLVGIGRWRRSKNGRYGSFAATKIDWKVIG